MIEKREREKMSRKKEENSYIFDEPVRLPLNWFWVGFDSL